MTAVSRRLAMISPRPVKPPLPRFVLASKERSWLRNSLDRTVSQLISVYPDLVQAFGVWRSAFGVRLFH